MNSLLLFLLPSDFLTLLCVTGGLLCILRWRGRGVPQIGKYVLSIGVTGFALILLLPVDVLLLRPLENYYPLPSRPAHVDGIVVLGGAITASISGDRSLPTLNRDADRLVNFIELARAYPEARLIFAGGPPATEAARLTEAEASRRLLDGLGLEPSRVQYDDQSRTTWENAVNALKLAKPKPGEIWILVTSASHMPRAVGAMRGAGWSSLVPWPVAYRTMKESKPPLEPMTAKLAAVDLAAHEWIGLIVYRLEGRTESLLPDRFQ